MWRASRAQMRWRLRGADTRQHSSGEHVRHGRITRQGKPIVRALLTQAAWRLIEKDPAMQEKYERMKVPPVANAPSSVLPETCWAECAG